MRRVDKAGGGLRSFSGVLLLAWAEEDGLFVGALDFDAVGFDGGIVFEGVMDDAAVEGVHGLEFDYIAPAPHFFGCFLGFAHDGITVLGAVAADIDSDFRAGRVLLVEEPVEEILEIGEGLALAADEPPGILGFDVEEESVIQVMFFDGGFEAQALQELLEGVFGLRRHSVVRDDGAQGLRRGF